MDGYALAYLVKLLTDKTIRTAMERKIGKQGIIMLIASTVQSIAEKDTVHPDLEVLLELIARI